MLFHDYLIAFVVLTSWYLSCVACLSCEECKKGTCTTSAEELNCKGEVGKDICGCCPRCLKVAGEICGGPWDALGKCDRRYTCIKDVPNDFNSKGKCVIGNTSLLPPCKIWKFYYKLLPGMICEKRPEIFCDYSCSECCVNHHACNPDPRKYLTVKQCQLLSNRPLGHPTKSNGAGHHTGRR